MPMAKRTRNVAGRVDAAKSEPGRCRLL